MSLSAEQTQALTDAVAMWRMQEYMAIPAYCLYVYYILTTMAEEVSIILPQKWNRGKSLYMVIRYGMLSFMILQLTRDYRSEFSLSPTSCKALLVVYDCFKYAVDFTCNFSLALCLGALLQARKLYLLAILAISCYNPILNVVTSVIADFQYAAEPPSPILAELGYPCYYMSQEKYSKTIGYIGADIRQYLSLATTSVLFLVGVTTFAVRYKGHGGGLVRVMLRDGGLHYLSLLGIKLTLAILWTPGVLPTSELGSNLGFLFATALCRHPNPGSTCAH
ncbi:hypothetical protein FA13DRAFT_1287540 [Coprinellus micaceus]|uniref:DUF6533 domain-containing protein n=1 Tax=Coprinellus micaceus TaxID=71717 RepID=A0A4Y7SSH0_COPMI|nr:hypothetical protein FA13DRAFT_1287540 [Coprinellus micaceus]